MNNEGPHPRKLDVIVDSWPYDVTARYWLDENAEIVAVGPQTDDLEAAYKAALLDLRDGLALAFQVGEMELRLGEFPFGGDQESARRAFDSLPPEDRVITPDVVERVYREREERTRYWAERHSVLAEFAVAQRREEGEELTLNEALRRAEEGEEQMLRIIEEDEEGH
jgi:hypothetical protein